MQKMIYSLLLWLSFSCPGTLLALNTDELPNQLFLTQHWISYTTSFDIETKTRKLGTLYRRVLSIPLAYDFYDNANQLLTTARARFFSIGAHFDVYDKNQALLGSVEEHIFTFFPTFTLYSNDSEKLARAEMNFWGTCFTLYDVRSDQVIAVVSRPFFRLKNDWTIDIVNKNLLTSNNIDPGLFLTVLAFQADSEYWQQQQDNNFNHSNALATPTTLQKNDIKPRLQDKITSYMNEQNLTDIALMDSQQLEFLAAKLDRDYEAQRNESSNFTNDETRMNDFVNYCLALVRSDQIDSSEKKAILYLLQQRLQ